MAVFSLSEDYQTRIESSYFKASLLTRPGLREAIERLNPQPCPYVSKKSKYWSIRGSTCHTNLILPYQAAWGNGLRKVELEETAEELCLIAVTWRNWLKINSALFCSCHLEKLQSLEQSIRKRQFLS